MLPVQSRRPAGSIGSGEEWKAWVKTLLHGPSGALVRPRAGLGLPGAVRPLRSRHLQRLISKLSEPAAQHVCPVGRGPG